MGINRIPMKAWKYAESMLWKDIIELLGQVWRQGKMPEDWRQSIIVLLYKREITESVAN